MKVQYKKKEQKWAVTWQWIKCLVLQDRWMVDEEIDVGLDVHTSLET